MDDVTERFNQALYKSDWIEIETCDNPTECYKLFLKRDNKKKKCSKKYKESIKKIKYKENIKKT